ncbi:hypothetical protein A0H76_2640 [Hepatospora eriocheir]|uniref:Uncharacterized protein n=1 Tax=Hepatospora eriocheir TaxID=1081669 RepID=A0A1X0QJL1_9MICR|nr:hypothetical protein A0H76_2640 [Hepatospora eriocheir]
MEKILKLHNVDCLLKFESEYSISHEIEKKLNSFSPILNLDQESYLKTKFYDLSISLNNCWHLIDIEQIKERILKC